MNNILLLTGLQLKVQLDLSARRIKDIFFRIILSVVKFVAITSVIYIALYLLGYFKWVSLDGSIPVEVLTVLLTIMLSLSLVTCVMKITDSLYFNKDNRILLTLPATKSQLFISRLIYFFIYELLKNINYFVTLFLSYGLVNHYNVGYYFWIIPCWILFTLLIVSISGLLSIPYMLLCIQLKRAFWLKILLAVAGIILVVNVVIRLIMIIPDNLNLIETWGTTYWKIQDFLSTFSEKMMLISSLSTFVAGLKMGTVITLFSEDTLYAFIWIMATIVVTLAISVFATRILFFRMASYPFEYKASKVSGHKKNGAVSPFVSFLKKELLLILRTPYRINSLILFAILTPVSIFLMNKIYSAMDVSATGKYMIYAFNILMITLLVTSSNASLSTVLSEEGMNYITLMTNPNKFFNALFPKIILNIVVMTISTGISVGVFAKTMAVNVIQAIMIFLIIECIYLSHAFWSAEMDINNPLWKKYSEEGEIINNPNEVKSSVTAFGLSVIVALFTYVNLGENSLNYYIAWTKLLVCAILFLTFRLLMYKARIKLYFASKGEIL